MPDEHRRFARIRHELDHQSDRGAAILAASYVDLALERALKIRLKDRKLPKKESLFDRLFKGYGPLSSFSARIEPPMRLN